jgi:hypothetical protein
MGTNSVEIVHYANDNTNAFNVLCKFEVLSKAGATFWITSNYAKVTCPKCKSIHELELAKAI